MLDLRLWQFVLIEIAMLLTAVALAYVRPLQRVVGIAEGLFGQVAKRPLLCFAAVFVLSITLRLAFLPIEPVPRPLFHDEFSYLLGADTFAHGRLTNMPPPVPIAFETVHVNIAPTYQSMYLPGIALALTLGRLLGLPWLTVLLLKALLCGTLYWAVSAWLPRVYGLAAGLVAIAITGSLNWWWDNYFCLALTSLATALVLGSLPRIARRQHWRSTLPFAAGLLILMLTRPYEGLCVTLPCFLVLGWTLRRIGISKLVKLAAAPSAFLALGMAWLAFYNWRGTGDPFLFAYALNFKTYHITGPFLFSARHPIPHYDLDILRRFYIYVEVPQYEFMHAHPWEFLAKKIEVYYTAALFGFGSLLILGVVYLLRRREFLWLAPLAGLAGFALNVVMMGWSPFPQYVAPVFPLLILLVTFGLFALRHLDWPRHFPGTSTSRGLVLVEAMLWFSLFGYAVSDSKNLPEPQYVSRDRAAVEKLLSSQPGKQLCLVRYTPFHESWQEWVFNGADLATDHVIWARSLDPQTDKAVMAAFPDREVWIAQPDFASNLVMPYRADVPFVTAPELAR